MRPARLTAVLASAVLLTLPSGAQAQEKYAIVIGINDYVEYDGIRDGDLLGAERDAQIMRSVLVSRWGVPEENVRELYSLEATKENIRLAITDWLASRARPGDLAVFYYAGHGSQAYDLDGDEPDGLDETIAPTDVMRLSSQRDIRDDELRDWLSTVSAEVVVILDSCHSGSATRGTGTMRARFLNREPPPEDGFEPTQMVASEDEAQSITDGNTTIIEIAAAAPDQSAMEGAFQSPDGQELVQGGAFTYHLVRQLWRAPADATYEELVRRTVSSLKADQFTQDPQFEGPRTRTLFSPAPRAADAPATAQAPPEPNVAAAGAVEVLAVEDGTVVLSGGEALGTTVGTVYRTEGGALLEVSLIAGDVAGATAVSGAPSVGEKATLYDVALPSPTLAVDLTYLPEALAGTVRSGLGGVEGISIVSTAEVQPDIYLRLSEDETAVEVLGKDGGVRGLVETGGGAAAGVGAALRKELAIKRLAALENPAAPFEVDLSLAGETSVFRFGDPIYFSIESGEPGYLTLIDLSPEGTITVLHPVPWEDLGRIPANVSVRLPGGGSSYTMEGDLGLGLVLAIVTPEPLGISMPDPNSPAQSGPDRDLATEIRDLLRRIASGGGSALRWATSLVAYEVVAGE